MPKIYAACGAVGFALSFLVGLFSGASFALVLVRALVFGVAFAALAVALRFLLNRFVPEIFEKDAAARPKGGAPSPKLDITIADDDSSFAPEGDSAVPDFAKGKAGDEGKGWQAKSGGAAASEPREGILPEGASNEDEAPARNDAASQSEKPDFAAEAGRSFAADEDDAEFGGFAEDEPSEEARPSSRSENFNPKASAVDAEAMAKAIRTVLSND